MNSVDKNERKSVFWYVLLGAMLVFVFIILPIIFLMLVFGADSHGSGNVAVIPINGVIMTSRGSSFGSEYVGSDDVVKFISEASSDDSIKAIILEINSPGGSAVASDEIAMAVKKVDKPIITVIREAGASGGYWIASSTDYIIANRMSITGSIGVISSYLEFSGIMEKYGVGYERLTAGKYKDIGTPFREPTDEERAILEKKLDRIHEFFISEVASNRHMDVETIRKLATGEFYLGVEAQEMGLVDELGAYPEAEKYLSSQYGIVSPMYVRYESQPGLLSILMGTLSSASFHVGEGIASGVSDQSARPQLR